MRLVLTSGAKAQILSGLDCRHKCLLHPAASEIFSQGRDPSQGSGLKAKDPIHVRCIAQRVKLAISWKMETWRFQKPGGRELMRGEP
jgi:hypothetical protein